MTRVNLFRISTALILLIILAFVFLFTGLFDFTPKANVQNDKDSIALIDSADKTNPQGNSQITRKDANGIRLFPDEMDLTYPHSNGRIPGREPENDPTAPNEPQEWDISLEPQPGDNWGYLREAFKKYRNIYLGPGVYPIDVIPTHTKGGDAFNANELIIPSDNSYIKFDPNAVIVVNPNNFGDKNHKYQVLYIYNKQNVTLVNPRIVGDKHNKPKDYKKIDTEEWAAGITIDRGSKNISILNPHITQMWGDAISSGSGGMRHSAHLSKTDSNKPEDVSLSNVFLFDNGRNNISHTAARNFHIDGGIIDKADRVNPKSGVDVEPSSHPTFVRGFKMKNIKFYGHNAIILFNGSMDSEIDDIEILGSGHSLISRGSSADLETKTKGRPEGYTQIHRNWKIGDYNSTSTGYFFIYMTRGQKIFKNMTFLNSRSANNILIQYGRGGEVYFEDVFMDGFKSALIVDDNRKRPNVGDVTLINAECNNGNFEEKGRFLVNVKTESKIHIENFKSDNARGFIIRKAKEIFLKNIELTNNIGSSTAANGYLFKVNAQKGTKIFMQNIRVNGIKIPDQDFTAQEDQTVVWLDKKGEFR